MNDLRFCPTCGAKLENDERFCGQCGFDTETIENFDGMTQLNDQQKLVEDNSNLQAIDSGQSPKSFAQNKTQKKSAQSIIIILSVAIGCFILIAGIAFWWFNQGKNIFGKAETSVAVVNGENKASLSLPSYSVNEGSYTAAQNIAIIIPAGEEVQVFYTIDGTDPTAKATKYETPIILQTNTTLKSIAIDKKGNQSGIKTATYTIVIPQTATTQPQTTTPAAATNADERAQFESNINGTWKVRDSSGFVLYYTFSGGRVNVTDGGSDYFDDVYSFNISPGNNGTIGTVDAGTHSFSIDCNPLGDNAIFINGMYASYN